MGDSMGIWRDFLMHPDALGIRSVTFQQRLALDLE